MITITATTHIFNEYKILQSKGYYKVYIKREYKTFFTRKSWFKWEYLTEFGYRANAIEYIKDRETIYQVTN